MLTPNLAAAAAASAGGAAPARPVSLEGGRPRRDGARRLRRAVGQRGGRRRRTPRQPRGALRGRAGAVGGEVTHLDSIGASAPPVPLHHGRDGDGQRDLVRLQRVERG